MYNKEDVNKRDNEGNTPLFYATKTEDIKELINLGADINHENNEHKTPLFYADYNKAKILIESGADVNHLDEGCASPLFFSDLKTSRLLIENGALVDQSDMEGDTPLSVAASYKDIEKGKFLIENGASIYNVNLSTFSALELMPDELRDFALSFDGKKNDLLHKEFDISEIPKRLSIPKF